MCTALFSVCMIASLCMHICACNNSFVETQSTVNTPSGHQGMARRGVAGSRAGWSFAEALPATRSLQRTAQAIACHPAMPRTGNSIRL